MSALLPHGEIRRNDEPTVAIADVSTTSGMAFEIFLVSRKTRPSIPEIGWMPETTIVFGVVPPILRKPLSCTRFGTSGGETAPGLILLSVATALIAHVTIAAHEPAAANQDISTHARGVASIQRRTYLKIGQMTGNFSLKGPQK